MSRLFTRNLKCRPQIYRKAASGPLPASLFSSLAPDAPAPAYSDRASLHCPKTQARYWLCSHSPRAGGTAPLPPPLLPSFFFPFPFSTEAQNIFGEMHKMYRQARPRTFWIQGLPPGVARPHSARPL